MAKNPLLKIQEYGQSIWMDFLRRGMITSGELKKLIEEDGLRGITSNPAIFEKVIDGSNDYKAAIRSLALEGKSTQEIYETLTVEDVLQAADLFSGVYKHTEKGDGYISLEVSPHLAHDTDGTIDEARHLWKKVGRPNIFIKVPATLEGLPAIKQLISEGVNVNVTLLFGLERYRKVADAYLSGLEKRVKAGNPVEGIASVASFFLSRIDVMVDPMLDELMKGEDDKAKKATALHGQVAIASARVAYQIYKEIYASERFEKLEKSGARPQRLLWASTSTKNPEYSDRKYVEALIGPNTVNTVPMETLNAYRDHGKPEKRLENDIEKSKNLLEQLKEVDIDLDDVTQKLEDEGVEKFNKPYDSLMESLEKIRKSASSEEVDPQYLSAGKFHDTVEKRMKKMQTENFAKRLWRKDASLWKKDEESKKMIHDALGWLHSAEKMLDDVPQLQQFASGVKEEGFTHVVHMGMGGSSLAPLVFERSFDVGENGLPLTVLDTTDPLTILKIEKEIDPAKTLFIVASKSGTTSEPLAFGDYFYSKVKEKKGDKAGENFVAITDPGTPLVDLAHKRKFRNIFLNFKDIGGRYSALTYFGIVPAVLMGLPVGEILERGIRMLHACSSCVEIADNPGLSLGAMLGELAKNGHDKLTFIVPESLSTLGMWLEQLLAESTGKENTGILPVAGEPLGDASVYGDDRIFAYLSLKNEKDENLDEKVRELISTGQPVVTIRLDDRYDLAQEFFRWEIATATAGAIIGINAFNQPNVQESKDNTKRLLKLVEKEGKLHEESPVVSVDSLKLYASEKADNARNLLTEFFKQARAHDYVALQAYLPENPEIEQELQSVRVFLRDHLHLASTLGYGPRFLHSTGQYHKGGPNNGLFLQLTADEYQDAEIPERPYSFGVLKEAQALGDLEALRKHNRRVLRIHLSGDPLHGLKELKMTVEESLS
jgi:transaldolase/glucose-6-phosphate isomerase